MEIYPPACPDERSCERAETLIELAELGLLGHGTPVTVLSGLQGARPSKRELPPFLDSERRLTGCGEYCAALVFHAIYSDST